jgi:hypothetical protein
VRELPILQEPMARTFEAKAAAPDGALRGRRPRRVGEGEQRLSFTRSPRRDGWRAPRRRANARSGAACAPGSRVDRDQAERGA